jgi:hypothetical protein
MASVGIDSPGSIRRVAGPAFRQIPKEGMKGQVLPVLRDFRRCPEAWL